MRIRGDHTGNSRPLLRCMVTHGHGRLDCALLGDWWFCGGAQGMDCAAVAQPSRRFSGGAQALWCMRSWEPARRPACQGPAEEPPLMHDSGHDLGTVSSPRRQTRPRGLVAMASTGPGRSASDSQALARCLGDRFGAPASGARAASKPPPPFGCPRSQATSSKTVAHHRCSFGSWKQSACFTSRGWAIPLLEGLAPANRLVLWAAHQQADVPPAAGRAAGRLAHLDARSVIPEQAFQDLLRAAPASSFAARSLPKPEPPKRGFGGAQGELALGAEGSAEAAALRWATTAGTRSAGAAPGAPISR